MKAAAICLWGLRYAIKRPLLWIVLAVSLVIVPFCHSLSPFTHLGLDPTWELAEQWALPFGMLGCSFSIAFLSGQEEFLRLLAPRTRWAGEWGTLWLASALLQLPLALSAMVLDLQFELALAWLLSTTITSVIVTCGGFIALRLSASSSTRVIYLWIFLWGLPGLLA